MGTEKEEYSVSLTGTVEFELAEDSTGILEITIQMVTDPQPDGLAAVVAVQEVLRDRFNIGSMHVAAFDVMSVHKR